ncbi:single-stranded DNA-binding protein [uncultured Bacteroides sp.]|uniref:single-stranded DNA-binding protein n=1 Tax=uncultured Bacteroides sp. TaxID=162156 RepID=UPI002629BC90|nr:single-stranded DNA-binding protein [uncultured Bacteroides sp.]
MSVNKIILLGHVGKEPEVRTVGDGVAVATFTLATTERGYTLQNGTQVPDRTEWHNIVVWRKQAEVCGKYVHKGDKLYVEGKVRTRSYDDNRGIKRYVTEVFVEVLELLVSKPVQQPQSSAQTLLQSTVPDSAGQLPMPDYSPHGDGLPF